jgi:hypothetical protein
MFFALTAIRFSVIELVKNYLYRINTYVCRFFPKLKVTYLENLSKKEKYESSSNGRTACHCRDAN